MKFPQFDVYRAARRAEQGALSILDGTRNMGRNLVEAMLVYATIGRYLAQTNPNEAWRLYAEARNADDFELRNARAKFVGKQVRYTPSGQYDYVHHTGVCRRVTRVPGENTLAFSVDGGLVAEVELVEDRRAA